MKNFLVCRRTYIATLAIVALTSIGLYTKDPAAVSIAIGSVAIGLAAANAYEGKGKL